jgi:4a-hydroxytetrahydrobiopterin dehydratase
MLRKSLLLRKKRRLIVLNRKKTELSHKHCIPCEGGIPPLSSEEINDLRKGLHKDWKVVNNKKIVRFFNLVNYKHTIDVVNKIAVIAEEEGHHPVMHVFYARLEIELYTFSIDGLSENDFILAAKIDEKIL